LLKNCHCPGAAMETLEKFTTSGERCCCSGVCIDFPCWDRYAPNRSGCCCCHPRYDEEAYSFDAFFSIVVPRLHTGDVFLASWPKEEVGLNRCMMHSRSTHVGLVYRPSDCPEILRHRDRVVGDQVDMSRPLLMHVLLDGECGRRDGNGLELVDLEVWVKDYIDKFSHSDEPEDIGPFGVSVRMLHGVSRNESFYQAVEERLNKYWDVDYEHEDRTLGAIDLCQGSRLPCFGFEALREDDSSIFCSEFVAEVYKAAGLLDPDLSAGEFLPSFFDTSRRIALLGDACLSREHVLIGPDTLEERNALGYKHGPPAEAAEHSFEEYGPGGFWGVEVSKPLPSLEPDSDSEESEAAPRQVLMS